MKTLFFQMASTLLVIICMFSTFIYFVIKRKKVSKTLTNREDFFVKIVIGIVLVIMFVKMFMPVILDIPYYLKNLVKFSFLDKIDYKHCSWKCSRYFRKGQ